MFDNIIQAHANVLVAIAASEGETEAQESFNQAIADATATYESEQESNRETVEALQTRISELEAEAQTETATNAEQVANMTTRIEELEGNAEAAQTQLSEAQARIAELETANRELSEATDQKPVEVETNVSEADLVPDVDNGDSLWTRTLKKTSNLN